MKPLLIFLVAGVLTGGLSAMVVRYSETSFMLPDKLAAVDNYSPPELQKERAVVELRLSRSHGLCMGGSYGLLLGLLCSVAFAAAFGSSAATRPVALTVIICVVLGAAAGAGGGRLAVYLSELWQGKIDLIREGMIRGSLFLPTALVVGLTVGLCSRGKAQTAVFAVLGGVVAAMVAPIMNSLLFPASHSEHFLMDDVYANAAVFALGGTLTALALSVGIQNGVSSATKPASDPEA